MHRRKQQQPNSLQVEEFEHQGNDGSTNHSLERKIIGQNPRTRTQTTVSGRRPRRQLGGDNLPLVYLLGALSMMLCFLCVILLYLLLSDSDVPRASRRNGGSRWAGLGSRGGGGPFRSAETYVSPVDLSKVRPPLIVGGSDGSGTRAFVNSLKQLGVDFVADDPVTFDLHGAVLFNGEGWPALINNILPHTHSGNYEFDNLPEKVQTTLSQQISDFVRNCKRRYILKRDRNRLLATEHIDYAFKAPVSMLALPVLSKFFGRVKFLHIIRDGRDVALSSNQSPVEKFYNTTYVDAQNRSQIYNGELQNVKAMQLWNDWNIQVHEWGIKHNGRTIDYLIMRSEDLLDPNKRFKCLAKLAEFVGSTIDNKKLCCLSQKNIMDYGTSNKFVSPEEIAKSRRNSNKDRLRMTPLDRYNDNKSERHGLPYDHLHSEHRVGRERLRAHLKHLDQPGLREHMRPDLEDRYVSHRNDVSKRIYDEVRNEIAEKTSEKVLNNFNERHAHGIYGQGRRLLEEDINFKERYEQWKLKVQNTTMMDHATIVAHMNTGVQMLKSANFHLPGGPEKNQELLSDIKKELQRLKREADDAKENPKMDFHDVIAKRYGKWVDQLANRTKLSKYLHQEGSNGLRLFGYEPRTDPFRYRLNRTLSISNFTCDPNVTSVRC